MYRPSNGGLEASGRIKRLLYTLQGILDVMELAKVT
jgi:hypothetical protein